MLNKLLEKKAAIEEDITLYKSILEKLEGKLEVVDELIEEIKQDEAAAPAEQPTEPTDY